MDSTPPPQVGGGPIDELTAYGVQIHRQLSFVTGELTGSDPDLFPAYIDPRAPIVLYDDDLDAVEFPDGCRFVSTVMSISALDPPPAHEVCPRYILRNRLY